MTRINEHARKIEDEFCMKAFSIVEHLLVNADAMKETLCASRQRALGRVRIGHNFF